jgi:hypothetical protein
MTSSGMNVDLNIDNGIDAGTRVRICEGLAQLLA